MSIYATLWALKFPRFGEYHRDCEWVTVIARGVPAHIGEETPDPYAVFLPQRLDSIVAGLRAVVFVTEGTSKSTHRSAQEYQLLQPDGSRKLVLEDGSVIDSIPGRRLHEPDRAATGWPISEVLQRDVKALRARVRSRPARLPFDVYKELDPGPGGCAIDSSSNTRTSVRIALKRKHGR